MYYVLCIIIIIIYYYHYYDCYYRTLCTISCCMLLVRAASARIRGRPPAGRRVARAAMSLETYWETAAHARACWSSRKTSA